MPALSTRLASLAIGVVVALSAFPIRQIIADDSGKPSAEAHAYPRITRLKQLPAPVNMQVQALVREMGDLFSKHERSAARKKGEEALAICREYLGDGHFRIRQIETFIINQDWDLALDDERRAAFKDAFDLFTATKKLLRKEEFSTVALNCASLEGTFHVLDLPPSHVWVELYCAEAEALRYSGKPKEAIESANAGCRAAERAQGEASPLSAKARFTLAVAYGFAGEYDRALRIICDACAMQIACADENDPEYCKAIMSAASVLVQIKDFARARRCIAEIEGIVAPHPEFRAQFDLWKAGIEAAMLLQEEKNEEALQRLANMVVTPAGTDAKGERGLRRAQAIKGLALLDLGRLDEAGSVIEAAHSATLRDGRQIPIQQVTETYAYSRWLVATGKADKAKELLKWRIEAISRDFGQAHPDLLRLVEQYSSILQKDGDPEEAKLAEERLTEIVRTNDGIRERIRSDPTCMFPWE